MPCTPSQCIDALGRGRWDAPLPGVAPTWSWSKSPTECSCKFGYVGEHEAGNLLAGRRLLFIGDSVVRRHMWSVIDTLTGTGARRLASAASNTTAAKSVAIRIAVGDLMHDEPRDKHMSQTVLVNVRTKALTYLSGHDICKYTGFWPAVDQKRCIAPQNLTWQTPPFVKALSKAARRISNESDARRELVVLSWLYASSIVKPSSVVGAFSELSVGYGADATIFGVDHTAVLSQRTMKPLTEEQQRGGAASWGTMLSRAAKAGKMCARPAVCLVRGVVHNGILPSDETLYRPFAEQAAVSVAASGAGVYLDALNATLDGVRTHAFEHHDLLRIHYNDRGREFMAQELLNALGLLLPRHSCTVLPMKDADCSLADAPLNNGQGSIRLQQPEPTYANVWRACAASAWTPSRSSTLLSFERTHNNETGTPLARACAACAPCLNASLEHAEDLAYTPTYV